MRAVVLAVLISILSALSLSADIAVVARASATADGSSTTLATPSTNSIGTDTIFVAVQWAGSDTVTVSDSASGALTACTGGTSVNGGSMATFYKQAATGASNSVVTATFAFAQDFRRIMVWYLSGGHASAVIDAGCVNNSGSASPGTTSALTPSSAGGIIIGAVSNNDGLTTTFTANNGFSLSFGANGTLNGTATFDTNAIEKLNSTGAQTPSVGMSATGGSWRMVSVALKPASVGGGGSTVPKRGQVF